MDIAIVDEREDKEPILLSNISSINLVNIVCGEYEALIGIFNSKFARLDICIMQSPYDKRCYMQSALYINDLYIGVICCDNAYYIDNDGMKIYLIQ